MTKELKKGDKLVLVSMGKVLKHYHIDEIVLDLAFDYINKQSFDVELKEDNKGRFTAIPTHAPMYNTFDIYLDESAPSEPKEIITFTLEEVALRMNVPVDKLVIISETKQW